MKSYEEIDREQEGEGLNAIGLLLLVVIVLVAFIFHLLIRHNTLAEKYRGCMDTVKLYSNAWEQTR